MSVVWYETLDWRWSGEEKRKEKKKKKKIIIVRKRRKEKGKKKKERKRKEKKKKGRKKRKEKKRKERSTCALTGITKGFVPYPVSISLTLFFTNILRSSLSNRNSWCQRTDPIWASAPQNIRLIVVICWFRFQLVKFEFKFNGNQSDRDSVNTEQERGQMMVNSR